MTLRAVLLLPLAIGVASCATSSSTGTLGELRRVSADTEEIDVNDSLERAMQGYRRFLDETPESTMTPEAMRRLADLQIEQQFGIIGDGEIIELPAPELSDFSRETNEAASEPSLDDRALALATESDEEFEERTTSQFDFEVFDASVGPELPPGADASGLTGPLEAIRIYRQLLEEYPSYERSDQVLYQMARAYDEVGQTEDAMSVMDRLVTEYGYSNYLDEVHFRRGEFLFTRREFREAEAAYGSIIAMGTRSDYYELALYKLGWALYKQEFYDLALERFMTLLDYRVSIGYDFNQEHEEDEERRVADTFRVISLSFSNIGGPEVVSEFFAASGRRGYEDLIYRNLGEFYLEKLRYQDAAAVYEAFVNLNPFHHVAPQFSMRKVEIYDLGGFPQLVVESKKDFATRYGLASEYWTYFDVADSPEVVGFLKTNLTDLANHYHALYQAEGLEEEQPQNFAEATNWYGQFLESFPADPESPGINYQLADLMLENQNFERAAREYERTAYEYEPHERASEAGYAAIFSFREYLKVVDEWNEIDALRATVDSSLRFADTFPEHENADIVLGAATDDLYGMNDFDTAIMAGRKLIERYPASDPDLRRAAWTVVAHSSFELERYPDAEVAYSSVLDFVPEDDEERKDLIDNLAASIYQQGDQANTLGDYRLAADHFLRIRDVAPTSAIRSSAEYDAAAALIRLEDWSQAGTVLEEFRATFPEHELQHEVTRQLASVYRNAGNLSGSASEYERVATESEDPELQQEALLLAGELYEDAVDTGSALAVYLRYLEAFPRPLDIAQETRSKVAGMYQDRRDDIRYRAMLEEIVASDASAGADRTDRSRFLAAQSALTLTEDLFTEFAAVRLTLPFDVSLAEKRERMETALGAFESLVDYEVSEVTAAATYYIAEIYFDFSQSLMDSERPDDLTASETLDYDIALEEQAFPIEERAIEVHEQNYGLLAAGIYNPWIERSLARLAEVMPARYERSEISSGFMGSLDAYAYRSPGAPPEGVAADAVAASEDSQQAGLITTGDRDAF